jgi:hypothetical protein
MDRFYLGWSLSAGTPPVKLTKNLDIVPNPGPPAFLAVAALSRLFGLLRFSLQNRASPARPTDTARRERED